MNTPIRPRRKRPDHGVLTGDAAPVIIYLTVCTKDRRPWLAAPQVQAALEAIWRQSTHWLVGRYVLMPDHLHLFATPGVVEGDLDAWVRYWKGQLTRKYPNASMRWQSGHWDTRLRREESYAEKWDYVWRNPVRAGLAAAPEEWPYQGELNLIQW